MLTTHKISAELYFESFELLAFHTALDDYALAYALNEQLALQLHRVKTDINPDGPGSFSLFEWIDELNDVHWMLFKNKSNQQIDTALGGLFDNARGTYINCLVNERKEVDYFLKIQTDDLNMANSIAKIANEIPEVITAYTIDVETLQSRKNLII